MSFFFTKAGSAGSKTRTTKPKAATQSSKQTLNRLGCKGCPLDKADNCRPKMQPDLADKTDVYFLGEMPQQADDEKGPFESPAGRLLRRVVGFDVRRSSFDYVIRDYDQDKKQPSWVAMECCRSYVTKTIEEAKPKIIVGLGVLPLQWMLNSSDMIGLRGRIFAVTVGNHACYFLPTYGPDYVIEKAFNKGEPLRSQLGHCLKFDVKRAFDAAGWAPPVIDAPQAARAAIQRFSGQGAADLANTLSLLRQAAKARVRAIDLETWPLRPYAAGATLLTAAISFGTTNFAFALDHPKSKWKPEEKKQIRKALKEVLISEGKIIAHNAPFECEWLISDLGKDVIYHDSWECTMMQSHFLDERRGKRGGNDEQFQPNPYQALDFLVKQYFGLSYKPLFKLDRKNMIEADLDETLLYNGADTKYTLRLWKFQTELLKERGLHKAYLEAVDRQPTVALMQSIGIDIDAKENERGRKGLGAVVSLVGNEIHDIPEVQKYEGVTKQKFNPASQPELLTLLKDYLKIKKELINSEGKESTDKSTLAKIKHPIAKLVEDYRNVSKQKSTYFDPFELGHGAFIWPDAKIHPSFNTTFAETGRTSCVAGHVKIRTKDGIKQAKDVCINDLVWTHNNRWRRVVALWRKGIQPMYNVYLNNGSILTCTKDHRVLGDDKSWHSIGDICGLFKKMGGSNYKSPACIGSLPFKKDIISKRNSKSVGHNRIKCLVGDTQLYSSRRVEDFEDIAIFGLKVGKQKPNDRIGWGEVPTLERHMQRLQRLFYDIAQGEKEIRPSCGGNGSFETSKDTTWVGNSSYRRRHSQQSIGQFGFGDKNRTSGYPLKNATGQQIVTIEKIETCGSSEVFDLTIEGDASYESCGIFSHNSDEPNQQNWPSRHDKWVRKQLVAPKGHVFVAFDFGQLEACTAAMCTRDKVLVKALWEDYDIHMEWAIKAAKRYPTFINGLENIKDQSVIKPFRSVIKNKLVFPAFFGAKDESVAGYLGAPIEPITKLMNEFRSTFHGVFGWQERLMRDYYEIGYVESPTGRRRHYPLTKNQAVNYPIQSVACDIVCRAMVRLSITAIDTGKWWLHPVMNIHDDLTFIIPDKAQILEESIETIYRTMLTPPYSFVNVPLSVSASIGANWLEMEELGKFWSHKDL